MALLDKILEPPSYGWMDQQGNLIKPAPKQILKEFFQGSIFLKHEKTGYLFSIGLLCFAYSHSFCCLYLNISTGICLQQLLSIV